MSTRTSPSEKLIETLRQLQAAGPEGFEGLILNLLTQVTGRPFRLARSGSQAGRDMSAGSGGELVIAVECKRFGDKTDFDDSQLTGKINDAKKDVHPDIWALVASRPVGDRTATSIKAFAESEGIECLILDCAPGGSGYLPALCAEFPETTVSFWASHAERRKIRGWLSSISGHLKHKIYIEALRRKLCALHLGFASTADALFERFLEALSESRPSKVRFGQRILPRAPESHDVPRLAFINSLDSWWLSWGSHKNILVVDGEEGTGKSWALASWLSSRTSTLPEVPIIAWLSAQFFDFRDLAASLAAYLETEFPARSAEVYERRLFGWAGRKSEFPRIVVVIDGINERASRRHWQKWLLDACHDLSKLRGVSLIITSRSLFWNEIAVSTEELRELAMVKVDDFNNVEFENALESAGLSNESIPPTLANLVRRPRFFSIAARHWARLAASGDFTRERLFFEERRDSVSSRRQHELSDREFEEILIEAARTAREATNSTISRGRLVELLSPRDDLQERLIDLVTSGVLEIVPGAPGKYRISKDRLYVGLGLLLLEEAVTCPSSNDIDVAVEAVTSAMEPAGDADDVGAIMRYAVCAALVSSGTHSAPREARIAVLLALARQRNGADAWQQAAPWIYYPDNPGILLEAAEIEWSRTTHHAEARQRFAFCLSHVADRWPTDANLVQRVGTWLGYVHPDGFVRSAVRTNGGPPEQAIFSMRLAQARAAIDSLGLSVRLEEVREQSILGVSQLAFLIASHGPHREYVSALVSWALSRSVMKHPLESAEARWWARAADAGTRIDISATATRLAALESEVAQKAAALLFRLEGSRESFALADSLDRSSPLPGLYFWDTVEEAYAARLDGGKPRWIAEKLTTLALDSEVDFSQFAGWGIESILDSIDASEMGGLQQTKAGLTFQSVEQALCRLTPRLLANLFLRAVHGQLDRVPSAVSPYLLEEAFILLEQRDLCRVREIQEELDRSLEPTTDDHCEADLAGAWLASLPDGESQLTYLLSRRQDSDDQDWSELLAPLSETTVREIIENLPKATGVERRRFMSFPWREAFELQESDQQTLRAAAGDPEVGTVGVLPPQRAQDSDLLMQFAEDGHYDDDELLSRIFRSNDWAREVAPAMSARLGERMGLASRTWAIVGNGLQVSDVKEWVKEMDDELRRTHGPRTLKPDGHYSAEVFSKAFEVVPEILDSWIESILAQGGCGYEITGVRRGVLERLVVELLNRNDRRGCEILRSMAAPSLVIVFDRGSKTVSHYFWPFKALGTRATNEAIAWMLEQAIDNDNIQQLVFAGSYYGRIEALMNCAVEAASRGVLFQRARSLMISGLGPHTEAKAFELGRIERSESSWVRFAAEQARLDLQRDGHAQHWFRSFLCSQDRAEAWAAFRLFLKCVDRRWLLWHEREIRAAQHQADFEMRRRHLILNWRNVRDRVEKRADEQKKRLFAWQVPSFDLVPWKRAWRL